MLLALGYSESLLTIVLILYAVKEHTRIAGVSQDDRWEDGNHRYIQVETPDLNPESLLINKQKANILRSIVKVKTQV